MTGGDPGVAGSHDLAAHTGGFAAGLDYRIAPDTVVGFALAGGGTTWSLAAGLGGGRGDVFQAGVYGARHFGPAYLSGALSYGSFWVSTSRTVTVAGTDQLGASFVAQDLAGRLEGGYRVSSALAFAVTPYAALQAQTFRLPAYGETATAGSPQFALSYNAKTATAVRAELGSWADNTVGLRDGSAVKLFGRLAWAHDWQSDPSLNAMFQGLPTASFVINGATPPRDLLLLTIGAEWHWRKGWAFLAKLDGEFADRSQTYAGTARAIRLVKSRECCTPGKPRPRLRWRGSQTGSRGWGAWGVPVRRVNWCRCVRFPCGAPHMSPSPGIVAANDATCPQLLRPVIPRQMPLRASGLTRPRQGRGLTRPV
jgi:outer membrane autotransporter protein